VSGRFDARLGSRLAIVNGGPGDAVGDQIHSALRGAVGIETNSKRTRGERIVPDIDALIELLHTDLQERLTLVEGLPVEAVDAEEHGDRGNTFGAEHHFVLTRLDVVRIGGQTEPLRSQSTHRRTVEIAEALGGLVARPGHGPDPMDAVDGGAGLAAHSLLTEAVGERRREGFGVAETGGIGAFGCRDEVLHLGRPLLGGCGSGCLVVVVDRRNLGGWCETCPLGIYRRKFGCFQCSVDQIGERRIVGAIVGALGNLAVQGDGHLDSPGRVGDVLMDERVGVTGERRLTSHYDGLGLGPIADQFDYSLCDGFRIGHPVTPTLTLLNRPGEAECPVCPTCIGCPFPQLGVPQLTLSASAPSMSNWAQNCGVIPV